MAEQRAAWFDNRQLPKSTYTIDKIGQHKKSYVDIEACIQLIRYRITIYYIQLYSHKKYLAYSLLFLCIMYRHSNLNKMNTTQWHERNIQIPHATPTIQNKLYYMSFHYILHAVCNRFIFTIVSIWKERSFLVVTYFQNIVKLALF